MKRVVSLTESDLARIVKRVIQEQVNSGTGETQVAGPFGNTEPKFYIFNKGGKFYIYQTNASQKTPILMGGTLWSNSGKGYNTQEEANKIIQDQLRNQQTGHEEDSEIPLIESDLARIVKRVIQEQADDDSGVVVNVNDIDKEDMKCFYDISAKEALKVGLNHGGKYKVKKRGCSTKIKYVGEKIKTSGNKNFFD